jgi:hypothetical protein
LYKLEIIKPQVSVTFLAHQIEQISLLLKEREIFIGVGAILFAEVVN